MSPQDPSPFHDKNPFEVLGLRGTEDLPAIRKAFLAIAGRSHPDRLRMKSPEEKAQALEIFLSAKKAFEVLSQPDKRREWSERMAHAKPAPEAPPRTPTTPITPITPIQPIPEPKPAAAPPARGGPLPAAAALQLYKLGMLALESADYARALELFARATRVSPSPRHQAMEQVSRGYQYLTTRFFERARESFERALQLLPECREARAGLELLDKQSGRSLKGR
ncbi:DnaJ domain-containing protein [Archangium violaceum]|uniref:tetratricopeptide repeat protein n=1 Tax=Archangium violaceum TaxID=83451 RepID=UPI00193B4B75|nr:DnaJ domain-containing protein [Archangium violaceum]QRK11703.1 DnaJ domain-containing protein [Archangium violaceum]